VAAGTAAEVESLAEKPLRNMAALEVLECSFSDKHLDHN
jgi:hypothetical protein